MGGGIDYKCVGDLVECVGHILEMIWVDVRNELGDSLEMCWGYVRDVLGMV